MARDGVEVHKLANENKRGQYPAILTEQAWSERDLFMVFGKKKLLRDTVGSPERAR